MTLERDTQEILTDGQHVQNMIDSDGWKIVKAKLDAKILDLQMIGNVEGNTPDEKVKNMEARSMAVGLLFEWLKSEVYGFAEQQNANREMMRNIQESDFVDRKQG